MRCTASSGNSAAPAKNEERTFLALVETRDGGVDVLGGDIVAHAEDAARDAVALLPLRSFRGLAAVDESDHAPGALRSSAVIRGRLVEATSPAAVKARHEGSFGIDRKVHFPRQRSVAEDKH